MPDFGSVADALAEQILQRILAGELGAGARVPAERELCTAHKASRASVREAMKRLELWGVLETRQSGAVVCKRGEWRLPIASVLTQRPALPGLRGQQLLAEVLELRRLVLCEMVPACAPRMRRGVLEPVRQAVELAWSARGYYALFSERELEAHRRLLDAAGLAAPLWLLNSLADTLHFQTDFSFLPYLPTHFVEEYDRYLGFLERGRSVDAGTVISRYLHRHDRSVMRFFTEATAVVPDWKAAGVPLP